MTTLAIDIGRGSIKAAVADGGTARLVRFDDGSTHLPCVVGLHPDGSLMTGFGAASLDLETSTAGGIPLVKLIGDERAVDLGDRTLEADDGITALLSAVVESSGLDRVDRLVLTHSAELDAHQVEALGRLGQSVVPAAEVLLVPAAAAALWSALDEFPEEPIAVWDVGALGSTLSLVGPPEPGQPPAASLLHSNGFSGATLDQQVMGLLDGTLDGAILALDIDQPEDFDALRALAVDATRAREQLSTEAAGDVEVKLTSGTSRVRLTRADFESAVDEQLRERATEVREMASEAGAHRILVVGGAAATPALTRAVRIESTDVITTPNPRHAAVLGAATWPGAGDVAERQDREPPTGRARRGPRWGLIGAGAALVVAVVVAWVLTRPEEAVDEVERYRTQLEAELGQLPAAELLAFIHDSSPPVAIARIDAEVDLTSLPPGYCPQVITNLDVDYGVAGSRLEPAIAALPVSPAGVADFVDAFELYRTSVTGFWAECSTGAPVEWGPAAAEPHDAYRAYCVLREEHSDVLQLNQQLTAAPGC